MNASGIQHPHPPRVPAPPGRPRTGFTLVETVVALAIAGAVFVPSVVLVQRLLAEDGRLDTQVADNLQRRAAPLVISTTLPDRP